MTVEFCCTPIGHVQSPLLRSQNPHPLGVCYNADGNAALQLLGDVCLPPERMASSIPDSSECEAEKPTRQVRSACHAAPWGDLNCTLGITSREKGC